MHRFVPLLFELLASGEELVQTSAADVLIEIVSKRMEAGAKMTLVQQLGLVPVAAKWERGLPGDPEGQLPLKCARLLAALCTGACSSPPVTGRVFKHCGQLTRDVMDCRGAGELEEGGQCGGEHGIHWPCG